MQVAVHNFLTKLIYCGNSCICTLFQCRYLFWCWTSYEWAQGEWKIFCWCVELKILLLFVQIIFQLYCSEVQCTLWILHVHAAISRHYIAVSYVVWESVIYQVHIYNEIALTSVYDYVWLVVPAIQAYLHYHRWISHAGLIIQCCHHNQLQFMTLTS